MGVENVYELDGFLREFFFPSSSRRCFKASSNPYVACYGPHNVALPLDALVFSPLLHL